MKNWMWIVLVVIVTMLVQKYSGLSFFQFLIIAVPLMIIALTYSSFCYSFRASLSPAQIPSGYGDRIKAIENDEPALVALGFSRFDTFYLKVIPDVVVYAYRHSSEPAVLCVYHFGAKKSCDFVSRFVNDYTVTTTQEVDGGMTPRPLRSFLQIMPNADYSALFTMHRQASAFMAGKNLKPFEIKTGDFREYFMKSIREFSNRVRAIPFWPVLLIWWTITKRGRLHVRTIEEQIRAGFVTIR